MKIRWVSMCCALIACVSGLAVAEETTPKMADTIVTAKYVITMDEGNSVLKDGAVAISNGVIMAVGLRDEILKSYDAAEIIDDDNMALLPGLINGHTHSAMVLFRGLADDLDLMTWLQNYIFPAEGRYVDEDLIRAGASLACYEMIRGGTTTFVDMYFYPDVIASVVEECGLRAIIAAPMIDYPSPGFTGWDDSFQAGVDFARRWHGKNSRISPALAPHAPYTVSFDHLKAAFTAARELDVPISIHLAEDKAEVSTISEQYGTTSVQLLSRVGMLNQPTIAAHVVWPTPTDIAMLARSQVGVIHNPTSNLKTAAGVSPVPQMLKAGVKVGLGTDGAASNNDLDMWEEIRLAALIHKGVNLDPTLMPAIDALGLATSGGAKAIDKADTIGSIKVGMQADMIQVSLDSPRLSPLYDVVSHLVYAATSQDVVTTIVDGQVLMRHGVVKTLDAEKVKADVEVIAEKIRAGQSAVSSPTPLSGDGAAPEYNSNLN
ncbi:amidohydrolase family protein [Kordiimonas pumila]|uniref:5-methylthioadenosine/S-adenosylhomocysteine deaminase n=1 Tax=Kordiimonas pumila TaxID=2161677 RepID=A0ABV7D7P7_9PROT|nr:amidohydrolase family protein [Kordiimonas pumila]